MDMDIDLERNEEEKKPRSRINNISIVTMKETEFRKINFEDPNEVLFRFITSHFYSRERVRTIHSVEIVNNDKLKFAFEKKKKDFKTRNIADMPILAYHGTPRSNITGILLNNFDKKRSRRQYHGPGHYFSECPSIALPYSLDYNVLIVCQILPGRQYKGSQNSWSHFDSKLVYPDLDDFSQLIVVPNKDQILPCAVIYLNPVGPYTQMPTMNAVPVSFPSTYSTVPVNVPINFNQRYGTFNPNIVFPTTHAGAIPIVAQPTGKTIFSTPNSLNAATPPVGSNVFQRTFSITRSKLMASFNSNNSNQSSAGTGQQLPTIPEAVFRPILKRKSKKDGEKK